MTDFAAARRNMIDGQLRPNRVIDPALLAAMTELPREAFLPADRRAVAYVDDDVPLGGGRWLMEPMVLARLIQAAQPGETDKALVVGAGCGYGAAVLSKLVASVVAIESEERLLGLAKAGLDATGCAAELASGDPLAGAPKRGPFDVILIEGAVSQIPAALTAQLAEGGRLVAVVAGAGGLGQAHLVRKDGGVASGRVLFDAAAPLLPGAGVRPGFSF